MVGWFVVWLVGWLVGSLFGCLVSWLGGWLVGWLVGCSLTLYIAAVSTAWPLLGSPQNCQATCYLFFLNIYFIGNAFLICQWRRSLNGQKTLGAGWVVLPLLASCLCNLTPTSR